MPSLDDGGARLLAFIDGLPVETRWLAGSHIVWQTGQSNAPAGVGSSDHTHCSAFVAALALDLDIYILRPPHHGQELLADAQLAWLAGGAFPGPTAADSGWRSLGTTATPGALDAAVAAANRGKLVVAGYSQPPIDGVNRAGHVVAVRPQSSSVDPGDGPRVAMAGNRNWREVLMHTAFADHPGAWPNMIALFTCDTDLEELL